MATLQGAKANVHCRKRSFEIALETEPSLRIGPLRHVRHGPSPRSMTFPLTSTDVSASKRRLKTIALAPSMPVHVAPVMSTTYPSFMSVYGSDEGSLDTEHVEIAQVAQKEHEIPFGQLNNSTASRVNHAVPFAIHHRGSIASLTTASTASSPATTHSSPMFTDPSPASSPESASSNPPLSIFKSTMQPSNYDRPRTGEQPHLLYQQINPSLQPRSDSPNGAHKNLKKLSLNMNAVALPNPATMNGVEGRQPLSEPSSPFKEPLRSARKKPTNLTIRTPGFHQLNFPRATPDIPPTPSSKPSIQTFQSSPSLPSLTTPTTSSSGGLHLSLPSFGTGHSRPGSDSSFSSQSASGVLPGLKEEDEAHKSQETQEPGYPDGPILIYDCGLYLYLEPTAEEASQFDTVINVAKEVQNPFESQPAPSKTVVSVLRGETNRSNIPEPQTAISEISFKSAWEFQPLEAPTPTTPRPSSGPSGREPEYLHVEWDHNSEILQDLYPLCQVIDERVEQGKKVLVHCQLGVSRSASLVIAFGLYKGYQPDFHSMYMQVKSRSQWVGPNMSLIYQLNDFRGKILKGEYHQTTRAAPPHWFKNSSITPSNVKTPFQSLHLHGMPQEPVKPYSEDSSRTPQNTKPLRSLRLDKELPPVPPFPQHEISHRPSHIVNQYTSPVVQPEALKSSWHRGTVVQNGTGAPTMSVQPRPLPFRKLAEYAMPQSIPPHRPRETAPTILHIVRPPSQMDLASQDVPHTPSLFSPRATEFMASPFGISSTVGDLAVNGPRSARSVRSISPPTKDTMLASLKVGRESLASDVDPRSPHQQGEPGEIWRHIDDFL